MLKVIRFHSLFWKIFFSFWLALILIVFLTALLTNYIITIDYQRPWEPIVLSAQASKAVEIYEEDGKESLEKYFDDTKSLLGMNIFLFDENNFEVTGKAYTEDLLQVLAMLEKTNENYVFMPGPGQIKSGALNYVTNDDRRYIFARYIDKHLLPIKAMNRRHFIKLGLAPTPPREMRLLFIIVSILVTGLTSYLLSVYLASPIQRLSAATKKLSAGDLSVRVSTSVSSRKDELGGLGKDFDQMASRLESLLSSQKRMLRDISHELRTPLARMQVALELARTKSNDKTKNEHDRIEYEAQRLNHLIGQILELVRLEQRDTSISFTNENVAEIVRQIVKDANFEATKQNKGVKLIKDESCYLEINSELLGSAIENIVRNAVTYTQENTNVEIAIEKQIEDIEYVIITIQDFGLGVPRESLIHLFEPFYKIRSQEGVDSNGYGIGLAIAKSAVQLHGGLMLANNGKESGLIITIKLPISQPM